MLWICGDPAVVCYDDGNGGFISPALHHMTDALSRPVLVLNRVFQPVQLTTAKRAFVLLSGGAAHALDDSGEEYDFELWRGLPVRDDDDSVHIIGGLLRVPRVLH